jgi:general secretion pathway protein G
MMREAIDQYTLDKQQPPQVLKDLVDAGYLRAIPVDPFTRKPDWTPVIDDVILSSDLKPAMRGLVGVQSSSSEIARDGTPLRYW